jgi:hypothetical protein
MSDLTTDGIRKVLRWEERLVQMMQRIAEDVLPEPVRYDDLTPEMVRDGFIRDHAALRARLARVIAEVEAQKKAWLVRNAGTDEMKLLLGVLLRIEAAARGEEGK